MALHNEIEFERDICHHLAAHGWLYAEGDAKGYDTLTTKTQRAIDLLRRAALICAADTGQIDVHVGSFPEVIE